MTTRIERVAYDDAVVRKFMLASILFGAVGLSVGLWIAMQLAWPALNFGIPYNTFSRLRPLHTNAVIFAFVGNMMFAGIYYSTQIGRASCRERGEISVGAGSLKKK